MSFCNYIPPQDWVYEIDSDLFFKLDSGKNVFKLGDKFSRSHPDLPFIQIVKVGTNLHVMHFFKDWNLLTFYQISFKSLVLWLSTGERPDDAIELFLTPET